LYFINAKTIACKLETYYYLQVFSQLLIRKYEKVFKSAIVNIVCVIQFKDGVPLIFGRF